MKNQDIDYRTAMRIAVEAECDLRSVERFWKPETRAKMRPVTKQRIQRALEKLGLREAA